MTDHDYWFDNGVTMGRLLDRKRTDNGLRVFSVRAGKLTIQLRNESWYLCRDLTNEEAIELIRVLATQLSTVALKKAG